MDCTGAEPVAGEVLIDGDRIKTVTRTDKPLPREGVTVIDGRDGFLMPGLGESHTHLSISNTSSLTEIGETPPKEQVLQTLRNAKLYLDHGFTSYISAGSVNLGSIS